MNEIERAIRHAAVAGGLRYWARKDRRAEAGLLKAAALHSAKSARALKEVGGPPVRRDKPPFTSAPGGSREA